MMQADRIQMLQGQMTVANQEYKEALNEAEALMRELDSALAVVLGKGTPSLPTLATPAKRPP